MSALGSFELLDTVEPAKSTTDPYEWTPPHWIPNPVPAEYDIKQPPWIRPEQAALSFVGELLE
jgi:hypothetical protein